MPGTFFEAAGRWAQRAGQLRTTDVLFRADYDSLDTRLSARLGDARPPIPTE